MWWAVDIPVFSQNLSDLPPSSRPKPGSHPILFGSRRCKFRLFCWRSIFYSFVIIFHIHYYMFLVSFLVCILWMCLSWICCVSSSFGAVCFGTLTRDEADGIWNCVVALRDPMVGQWWVYRQVPHNWNWEKGWESVHGAQSSKCVSTQTVLPERDSAPTNAEWFYHTQIHCQLYPPLFTFCSYLAC